MRRFLSTCLYILFLALFLQADYEVTEHAHERWGLCWPGWQGAVYAERVTAWRPRTGIALVDRLIHEETEARLYYRWLLIGSPAQTVATHLKLSQHG
jgi:hypothetical protein